MPSGVRDMEMQMRDLILVSYLTQIPNTDDVLVKHIPDSLSSLFVLNRVH